MQIKVSHCFYSVLTLVIFFSCNNDDKKTSPALTKSPYAKDLKDAVAKYPDSLPAVEKLIEYYRDNGDYDSALTVTDNALKKNSDIAELWDVKATLHFENDDTINAIKALETAINIYPLPDYIISLGTIYAETKNKKALSVADALLVANKAKAEKEAIFIKGLYYTYTGDKKKAINFFDSAIHIDYTYMFAYREKAIALYDMKKFEDALQVLTKAVTVKNSFDEGYYWMGKCNQQLNKKEEAIQNYQTALMYDKNFVEAKDSLHALGVR